MADHITARLLARRAPVHADVRSDGTATLTTVHVPIGADEPVLTLSLLDTGTGDERPVPCAAAGDHSAVWGPDGRSLVWCSTEDGRPVLKWATDVDGTAQLVPGSHGVAGAATWSPDGRYLAFGLAGTEPIDRTKPFRWTSGLLDFDGVGPLEVPPQVRVVELATGEGRWLTDDRWRHSTMGWSPDGTLLASCAGLDPDGNGGGQHLELLDLDGGRVTPSVPSGRVVLPVWLRDGRLAVLVVDPHDRPIGSASVLYVIDGDHLETVRTVDVDALIGGDVYGDQQGELADTYEHVLLEAPDGSLVVRTVSHGRLGIARLRLDTGTTEELVGGQRCCTPVGIAGDRLLFTTVSVTETIELATVGLDGSDERRLTDFADGEGSAIEVQRFAVGTDVPAPIDAWFVRPAGAEPTLPTVLMVHGGPNFAFGETFNVDVHALCAAGFGVLYANPRGSTGAGDDFTNAAHADWTDGPSRDLFAVLDRAIELGLADADRLGVTGNSYGGYMSAWLASTTDRFRAAVIENPVTDLAVMHATSDIGTWFFDAQFGGSPRELPELYASQSPLHQAHRCRTPALWVVGELDRRCPSSQAWAMHRALLRNGTPSEVLVLPGSSHEGSTYGPPTVRLAHDAALVEWMQQWVLA